MKLTQTEKDALANLSEFASKAMRLKPALRLLGKMQDKGLIEFHSFEGKAHITGVGHAALRDQVEACTRN